jgi:hypothetical protein
VRFSIYHEIVPIIICHAVKEVPWFDWSLVTLLKYVVKIFLQVTVVMPASTYHMGLAILYSVCCLLRLPVEIMAQPSRYEVFGLPNPSQPNAPTNMY